MKEYFGMAGTILGILIGFLLSEHQRRKAALKEKINFKLKKLEETYLLLGEFHVVSAEIGAKVMSSVAIDAETNFRGFENYDHIGRLSLLVDFYVPELGEDVENLRKQFTTLAETTIQYYLAGKASDDKNVVTAVEVNETCKVIAMTISVAKEKLVKLSKKVQTNV